MYRFPCSALATVALAAAAAAQGTGSYLNFETPQHHAVACLKAGTSPFLLVCNSPDNSVEVYSIAGSSALAPVFVARIPVGLEPISLAVKPTALANGSKRCYVANWLGDSITYFDIASGGLITQGPTVEVGDEPTDIAFNPGDESLIVTFAAAGVWGWLDSTTLQPVQPDSGSVGLADSAGTVAIREPRTALFSPPTSVAPNVGGLLFILNMRGGNTFAEYDYDIWGTSSVANSASSQMANLPRIPAAAPATWSGQVGTTNFDMAFTPKGDLFVASQTARNKDVSGIPNAFVLDQGQTTAHSLAATGTGFVRSQLVRIRAPGTANAVIEALDLNDNGNGGQAVPAITQPTSVLTRYDADNDETRVFVTGFASDSLGMVIPTSGPPSTWSVTRVDLRPSTNSFSDLNTTGLMRGPRSMAMNQAQSRIYIYDKVQHAVTIVDANLRPSDPQAGVFGTFVLQRDPTPAYIKDGRKFLYSSQLSGGNNVSCASCHIDGNSDFLTWNLSDGQAVPGSPNPAADQGGEPGGILGPNTVGGGGASFANRKGPMQTQSLRGLVNYEVENDLDQDRFCSNKPYHWRGDRADFQAFNGAFIDLMAIAHPATPSAGIYPARMDEYREFVNSIHYPPNPAQPDERAYSGSMQDSSSPSASDFSDPDVGSGAQRGLKSFMIRDIVAGPPIRSCVHCHALPEGSNNRFTDTQGYAGVPDLDGQRIETAALRALLAKERQVELAIAGSPTPTTLRTGEFGLIHTGNTTLTVPGGLNFKADSIRGFLTGFNMPVQAKDDVAQFVRELDRGTAPIVGRVLTVDTSSSPAQVALTLNLFEGQATQANAEVAVLARIGGVARGFWYDARFAAAQPYTEVPHTGVTPLLPMTRAALLGLLAGASDALVFECTPLGSGRRVAFLDGGVPAPVGSSAPTSIVLRACKPMIANRDIPKLVESWSTAFRVNSFDSRLDLNIGQNLSMIWFQASLLAYASTAMPAGFGVTDYRHEAPRRFVVSGTGIAPGARLRVYFPNVADFGSGTPTSTPSTSTHPDPLELPIFAAQDATNGLEWQTAAEIDGQELLALLNGGPNSPEVRTAQLDPESLNPLNPHHLPANYLSVDYFHPLERNWYYVQVINDPSNPSSTTSAGSWQRLTVD